MWYLYFAAVAVQAVLLFFPGFVLSSVLFSNKQLVIRLSVAPAISVALYGIVGILLSLFDIFGEFAIFLEILVPILIAMVAMVVSIWKKWTAVDFSCGWNLWHLFLVVIVASLSVGIHYVRQLDGPESYSQQADNIQHLSLISEIANDGNYSTLTTSSYSIDPQFQHEVPFDSKGYYPNGFHVIASFAVSILGVSTTLAENAAVFVFCALVYPMVMTALAGFLMGPPSLKKTLSVGFGVIAFASFPLALLTFGPLVPNLAAFCCMMSPVLLFIVFFEQRSLLVRMRTAALFIISCLGVSILQPNAIFAIGVFLVPYTAEKVNLFTRTKTNNHLLARVVTVSYLFFIVVLWLILVFSPFLKSVVMYDWPALETSWTVLNTVTSLSLRFGAPQYVLAIICVIGILVSVRNGNGWYVCSLIIIIALYAVGNSTDSIFKHIAIGFWYTDQWRAAALVAIFSMPAAAEGLNCILEFVESFVVGQHFRVTPSRAALIAFGSFSLITAIVMRPSYTYLTGETDISAFGKIDSDLMSVYEVGPVGARTIYSAEERAFVKRVKEIVGGDQVVLNFPYDGSVYSAYEAGLNTYYKTYEKGGESSDSRLIRSKLNQIGSSSQVRDAVDSVGAKYLLVLNRDGYINSDQNLMWSLCGQYNPEQWAGFDGDFDQNDHFRVILSDGEMRLYEII